MSTQSATDKTPITTQAMWDATYEDYVHAEILAKAARNDPSATPQIIANRERAARKRLRIANAMDFLITNEADIAAVIAARKRREA
jgi:hypothetical protein